MAAGENDDDDDIPFSGLVICVTGLSKEARKQVKEVTESLGGTYSPTLDPLCTHLLVHTFRGPKLEHALHSAGFSNHLFVVSLGWFIDSVANSARLHELPYSIRSYGKLDIGMGDRLTNSASGYEYCIPVRQKPSKETRENLWTSEENHEAVKQSHLSAHSVYIDSDVSAELHSKVAEVVAREGAMLVNQWFVGCGADYIVCEGSSIQKYLGHCDNIVSPIWFLKTSKERSKQRFVGLSADLAREAGLILENLRHEIVERETDENCSEHILNCDRSRVSQAERLNIVKLAKCGIRNRRARRLQKCEVPLRPINSSTLLDSICWSISEPTSTAAVYEDSLASKNVDDIQKHITLDGQERVESDLSFANLLRALTESEKSQLVFRDHFLTILFPVDRFAEMGPSSRTYFSDSGFTCLQLLDLIYDFYQESMTDNEIQTAIHTDSRHAETLRSMYCSGGGVMMYKRIQFIGSRKCFEKLKRVIGNNNSNVYELLIRV